MGFHSFEFRDSARSRTFGDCDLSPLETFARIKPDVSLWYKFGQSGMFKVMGKCKAFDEKRKGSTRVGTTILPGFEAYCIVKGSPAMSGVTNFVPLKISVHQLSAAEITESQHFPATSGTEMVSLESVRASQADLELLETSYTHYF